MPPLLYKPPNFRSPHNSFITKVLRCDLPSDRRFGTAVALSLTMFQMVSTRRVVIHESRQTNETLWALLLPLTFLGLLAGGVVASLGSLGVVAVGALATACLAMFIGFLIPILALGHDKTLVCERPTPAVNEVTATRTADEVFAVAVPRTSKVAA